MDPEEMNAITRKMLTFLEPHLLRGAALLADLYGDVCLGEQARIETDMYEDLAELDAMQGG